MPDREKVIKGLECLADVHDENCVGCGYIGIGIYPVCVREVAKDALALLKEQEDMGKELTDAMELIHKKNERIEKLLKKQEAVEPIISESYRTNSGRMSRRKAWCGACGIGINFDAKFCDHCGKGVKWNDSD